MSARDDLEASLKREEAKGSAAKPGLQRPSMTGSRPAPKPQEGRPAQEPGIGRPSMMEAQTSPVHKAINAARALHHVGLHPDHPHAKQYVKSTGANAELVKRWHARMQAEADKLPKPGKKFHPPDPSALGSG